MNPHQQNKIDTSVRSRWPPTHVVRRADSDRDLEVESR